jgi:hypothetical protein
VTTTALEHVSEIDAKPRDLAAQRQDRRETLLWCNLRLISINQSGRWRMVETLAS